MTDRERWRVLMPEDVHESGAESLREFADLTLLHEYDTRRKACEDIADGVFDAVVVRTLELDGEAITGNNRLRVVSKHGVGLDNIDVETVQAIPAYTEDIREIVLSGIPVYKTSDFETVENLLLEEGAAVE